jgi:hypothetical protein
VTSNSEVTNSCLSGSLNQQNLGTFQLTFSRSQLASYRDWRTAGLERKSINWMKKATEIFWEATKGEISKATLDVVRATTLDKVNQKP